MCPSISLSSPTVRQVVIGSDKEAVRRAGGRENWEEVRGWWTRSEGKGQERVRWGGEDMNEEGGGDVKKI